MSADPEPVVIPVVGDLLQPAPEWGVTHVVHQLNCLTRRSAGLALQVSTKWPWADVYSRRAPMERRPHIANVASQSTPGTIDISVPPEGEDAPICVGFFAQWDYGRPSGHRGGRPSVSPARCAVKEGDSARNRIVWFKECLAQLAYELNDADNPVVAFPYNIGCGLAQGNWDVYKELINTWSLKNGIKTYIVAWIGESKKRKRETPLSGVEFFAKRSKPL